ncbi:MAG: response regulator transcription factor [Anaerolineales bacterium]|nr:MAG: response regulator transcription factor [Anaerolineales bacterium]
MPKKKILVVDDEALITESLEYSFNQEGFQVVVAHDGHQALEIARRERPDLIVLDIWLPGIDGWEVCRQIRQESTVPIIMLTARGQELDRVLGLELGADDYLPKPFSFRELLARVRAIFRRIGFETASEATPQIQIGAIRLDAAAHKIYKRDQELTLTQKEYDLVHTLMAHAGMVVSRAELLDQVWGVDWLGDTRTLDVHIRWVREKIEEAPSQPRYIQTVRGVGYRFAKPEELK